MSATEIILGWVSLLSLVGSLIALILTFVLKDDRQATIAGYVMIGLIVLAVLTFFGWMFSGASTPSPQPASPQPPKSSPSPSPTLK